MSGWTTWPLRADVTVVVEPAPAPASAAAEAEVGRIWAESVAARPSLFDGRVFSVRGIEPGRIAGWWTGYRQALAQIRAPYLFEALRIRALAVNGVIEGPDGFVFGRRDRGAVYQPGLWQCPPAGSVEARADGDAVDLAAQVAAELAEELGMPADAVTGFSPIAAVENDASHVIDVGIALRTTWPHGRIAAAHAVAGNREYEELLSVPRERLPGQLAGWGEAVVPPARVFLSQL